LEKYDSSSDKPLLLKRTGGLAEKFGMAWHKICPHIFYVKLISGEYVMNFRNGNLLVKGTLVSAMMCYFVLWLIDNFGSYTFFVISIILLAFIFIITSELEKDMSNIHRLLIILMIRQNAEKMKLDKMLTNPRNRLFEKTHERDEDYEL